MNNTYAKIDSTSTVVNIQIAASGDVFDPTFTWVIIDGLLCGDGMSAIEIGCTYSSGVFSPEAS